jgi:hypothetical protein
MAELLIVHPNKPEPIHFPCPACGRDCVLEPKFHTEGAARGVRHGHGLAHSVPACRTYRTMDHKDFLKLATVEVPILRDDVHVSVKEPAPPPLIISDGAARPITPARTVEELNQLEAERHQREVEARKVETVELSHMRDKLQAEEAAEMPAKGSSRPLWLVMSVVFVVLGLVLLAALAEPWQH